MVTIYDLYIALSHLLVLFHLLWRKQPNIGMRIPIVHPLWCVPPSGTNFGRSVPLDIVLLYTKFDVNSCLPLPETAEKFQCIIVTMAHLLESM